jgi:hypothetical protein
MSQQPSGINVVTVAVLNDEPLALTNAGLSVYRAGAWSLLASTSSAFSGIVGNLGQGDRFFFSANGASGNGIYQFDAQQVTLLTPAPAAALAIHNDGAGPALYAAGHQVPSTIARYNGTSLEPLSGGGLANLGDTNFSLASWNDGRGPALYVAGGFDLAGGQPSNGFARWRSGVWENVTPYATPNHPPGPAVRGLRRTSLAVFQNKLYIAGEFTSIGAVNADHLAYVEPCPHGTCTNDYNNDGDIATDADIEAFFACLAGTCCPGCSPDFNADGDSATDADIESFFRVLAGGPC